MDHLYAPWREEYHSDKRNNEKRRCIFCAIPKEDELLLYRGRGCYVVANKYPYTPGHFLIVPETHCAEVESLSLDVWLEMNRIARASVVGLKELFYAQGVNIGINLGAAAGAGLEEHLHLHVLPRWFRDNNFMTSIGKARVYSSDFREDIGRLRKWLHTHC